MCPAYTFGHNCKRLDDDATRRQQHHQLSTYQRSIRCVLSLSTLAYLERKTFCSTLHMLWSTGLRAGEFGGHSAVVMKSGVSRSRKETASRARCEGAPSR